LFALEEHGGALAFGVKHKPQPREAGDDDDAEQDRELGLNLHVG
jgi:hypothetical protein